MKNISITFVLLILFCSLSYNQNIEWQKMEIPSDAKIKDMAINSNGTIYACTEYGIYASYNDGNYWNFLSNLKTKKIAIDNNDKIYTICNDTELYFSDDYGLNWQIINTFNFSRLRAFAINDSNHIFIVDSDSGIVISKDLGNTWDKLNNGLPSFYQINNVAINEAGHMFLSVSNGVVYKSTNQGQSWQQKNNGIPGEYYSLYGIQTYKSKFVIVSSMEIAAPGGSYNGVFVSNNNGEIWIIANQLFDPTCFVYQDSMTIYAGEDGLWKSIDGGYNWSRIQNLSVSSVSAISLVNNDSLIVGSGTTGGIFKSDSSCNNWNLVSLGFPESKVSKIQIHPSQDIYIKTKNGFMKFSITESKWILLNKGIPSNSVLFNILELNKNGYVFCMLENNFSETEKIMRLNGNVWQSVYSTWNGDDITSLKCGRTGAIIFSPYFFDLGISFNNGDTWQTINNPGIIICLGLDSNNNIYAADFNAPLHFSDNLGATWQTVYNAIGPTVYEIETDENNVVYIAVDGLRRSFDMGLNWDDISIPTPSYGEWDLLSYKPNHLFGASSINNLGVYYSQDMGDTWVEINNGLDLRNVYGLAVDSSGFVYAGTNNGFYKTTISILSNISFDEILPVEYNLSQNYPNPFNQSTIIPFSANTGDLIEIKIFDITGELIFRSEKESPNTGQSNISWNGQNQNNNQISSGIYFYQLKINNHIFGMKKMVLLK